MTRSEAGARSIEAAGGQPHLATLEDIEAIKAGATETDAVIHTAFDHDFSNYAENCTKDARVIAAIGSVLQDTDRPFLITSAVGLGDPGDGSPAREDVFDAAHPTPRIASEKAGAEFAEAGGKLIVIRLPQVHDTVRQGLISPYIDITREKGMAAYIGEGRNSWSAGHVLDVAKLYALALDKGEPGRRYHAVAEEGVTMREIAEAVGAGLGVPVKSLSPEEARDHFGWLSIFAGLDMRTSSAWTRKTLDWTPTGPDLLTDLGNMDYTAG